MITVVINGVDFDYPEVGDSEWGDPATKAFQSLCATTLQKVGGSFTLENDLTFGGNKGIHCLFFSSVGSDPALSGVYRLSKNELVAWRNEWNTDDFAITVDSTSGDLLIKSNELESYVDPDDGQTKYRPVLDGNGDPIPVVRRVAISGEIVNADVADSAGILESKLALDYSTDGLHTAIEDKAISNLKDTNINTPYSKQALMYDGGTSKWINRPIVLDDVSDTIVSNPNPGDILLYDGVRWSNEQNSVDALTDAQVLNPVDGDVLAYNSNISSWENSDKLTTVSSTLTTVSSTVTTHVADKNNPHETSLSNLNDTTISSPNNGDALTFDGNKWINSPSTSSSLSGLSDTDILTPIGNMDVLAYDDVAGEWTNTDYCSVHVNDYNNPHNTSVDNLTDSDIDSNTLTENDVMVFNDQTSKWENSQILVNHIGSTSNPHLTTVAKLTDTAITTPANRDVLYYDYANSQWINYPIASAVNNLWSSSVAYSVGDIVNYAGRTYKCAVAHTSSSVFEADFYGGKWDDGNIAGTIIQNLAFASSVPYHYFDVTGTDAGAEISQATYPNLYAVIGGTYDTCYDYVNGTQYSAVAAGNFRLPDFRNTFFKNSGSSTWGAGHNAQHKHTTAYDSGVSTTHGHSYLDQNGTTPINVPGAYYGGYWHFYKKYMNTSQDDTLYVPSFNAGHYSVSGATNQVTLTYPALAMQNQGSGTTPEPNNYGTRIFIKY